MALAIELVFQRHRLTLGATRWSALECAHTERARQGRLSFEMPPYRARSAVTFDILNLGNVIGHIACKVHMWILWTMKWYTPTDDNHAVFISTLKSMLSSAVQAACSRTDGRPHILPKPSTCACSHHKAKHRTDFAIGGIVDVAPYATKHCISNHCQILERLAWHEDEEYNHCHTDENSTGQDHGSPLVE